MHKQPVITIWISAVYFLFGYIGHIVAIPPGIATPVWPASGFALAMALTFGKKAWLGIFIGTFLIDVQSLSHFNGVLSIEPHVLLISFSIGVGSLLQAMFGAWLISRMIGDDLLKTVNTFIVFALSTFLMCLISSSIGVSTLYWSGLVSMQTFAETWITWLLGDAAGILLMTPLLRMYKPNTIIIQPLLRPILLYLSLIVMTLLSFGFFFTGNYSLYPLVYLSWPILLLFALNYEKIHTYWAVLIVSVVAIIMTVQREGPFYVQNINHSLLLLQSYIIVTTVTLVSISILSVQSRGFNRQLQGKVDEQTKDLTLMINELHHRVKNNFQLILTFLWAQKKSIKDEKTLLALNQTMQKIYSIASLHELLKLSDMTAIDIKTYILGIMNSFGSQEKVITYHADVEDISLEYDKSVAIGFILTELIINSHKYAFALTDIPKISVKFYKEGDKYILIYSDNGIGFDINRLEKGFGFGYELIYAYAKKNNATVSVSSDNGAIITITFR